MQGRKGGVAALLAKDQPLLQSVHCMSHRLELAYKDVLKEFPKLKQVQSTHDAIYNFYHNGALNRSMLERACEATGVKYLVPGRMGGTRWMPHTLKALDHFFATYPAMVTHMQQLQFDSNSGDAKAKAKGILNSTMSQSWLLYASMLRDVVAMMSKLSLVIQQVNCSVAGICWHLSSYSSSMLHLKLAVKIESIFLRVHPFNVAGSKPDNSTFQLDQNAVSTLKMCGGKDSPAGMCNRLDFATV